MKGLVRLTLTITLRTFYSVAKIAINERKNVNDDICILNDLHDQLNALIGLLLKNN
jgi:hypothetical protein